MRHIGHITFRVMYTANRTVVQQAGTTPGKRFPKSCAHLCFNDTVVQPPAMCKVLLPLHACMSIQSVTLLSVTPDHQSQHISHHHAIGEGYMFTYTGGPQNHNKLKGRDVPSVQAEKCIGCSTHMQRHHVPASVPSAIEPHLTLKHHAHMIN